MDLFKQLPSSSLLFDDEFQPFIQTLSDKAISSVDLVTLTSLQLAKATGRSVTLAKKFQEVLSQELTSTLNISTITPATLDDEVFKQFTTGDDQLDSLLDGGIPLGQLTEISGASATGKSHWLLQLAITVQLPREFGGMGFQISDAEISQTQTRSVEKYRGAKVVYICTESGGLETRRLEQICDHYQELMRHNGINSKYWPSTENVYQIACHDLDSQEQVVSYQLPQLLAREPVKLVIIDSVAHHLRVELNTGDPVQNRRAVTGMYKLAHQLKSMADNSGLAVVVSNQVSDRPVRKLHSSGDERVAALDYQLGWISGWDNETILRRQFYDGDEGDFSGGGQIPSLGIVWANNVDVRIVLSKYQRPIWDELLATVVVNNDDEDYDVSKNFEWKREAWCADRRAHFQIWKGGIRVDSN